LILSGALLAFGVMLFARAFKSAARSITGPGIFMPTAISGWLPNIPPSITDGRGHSGLYGRHAKK
jgi:hypothetical protein